MVARIEFLVLGEPIAQPRPRVGLRNGVPRVYKDASHPVHAWREQVRLVARSTYHGMPLEGPLAVYLSFLMPRPKAMQWKRRAMPRVPHTVKPDADNLAKASLDSLLGVVMQDDSQIAVLHVTKWIAGGDEKPGLYAIVEPLNQTEN